MKKSRFSEAQIAYSLRMVESGTPVVDVCHQIGISEATLYRVLARSAPPLSRLSGWTQARCCEGQGSGAGALGARPWLS